MVHLIDFIPTVPMRGTGIGTRVTIAFKNKCQLELATPIIARCQLVIASKYQLVFSPISESGFYSLTASKKFGTTKLSAILELKYSKLIQL